MRIALLISCLSNGGAERVVCNLANYLVAQGHTVDVIIVSNKQTYVLDTRVNCVRLTQRAEEKIPHRVKNIYRIYRLNRYVRREKVDVYITFLPKLTKILLSQKALFKAPVILAERNDPQTFCEESQKKRQDFLHYYPRADAYVFQTEDAKAFYQSEGIDVASSIVIPNAINPEFIGKAYHGIRTKRIVSVGRLDGQKNFAMLINAFARLHKELPDYKLEIYGEGTLRGELQGQIDSLWLKDFVSLPGRTNTIIEAIQDASLFVLPSNFEGMPNALAEAMALGLPCIATDCPAGGSRFLIQDGVNGLLVPVGDGGAMAESMKTLLSDAEYRDRLGSEAEKIQDRLEHNTIYNKWADFISDIVEDAKLTHDK